MSLEARIELLTSAIIELTAAIGAMQAPGGTIYDQVVTEVKELRTDPVAEEEKSRTIAKRDRQREMSQEEIEKEVNERFPNEQASSTATTSGEQSQPTPEQSSPALDYDRDVKTITLALSKAKGAETTKAILATFDVASAKQLVAGQWAAYIAACNEALK